MFDVTGQLFFRETIDSPPEPKSDTHKLVMVVGILAVPKDSQKFKGEHQVTVYGNSGDQLSIDHDNASDMTEFAKGHSAGGLLTLPMWHC